MKTLLFILLLAGIGLLIAISTHDYMTLNRQEWEQLPAWNDRDPLWGFVEFERFDSCGFPCARKRAPYSYQNSEWVIYRDTFTIAYSQEQKELLRIK